MNKNEKVMSNFIWRFLEQFGTQIASLLISLVLARLLEPSDYGIVAIVTVIITILQVFVDSGLGTALIQKKDADDLDFSTVFFFNLALCVVLYFLMFFISPYISLFYDKAELTPVIRVLSLTLVISGVKNIQIACVSRLMIFKRFFLATIGGTICSAFVGIYMAYLGYGVWALVYQNLMNTLVSTLILWITVSWRPKLIFSFDRLKSLLSFGWKLLVSRLLATLYSNIRQLFIGKVYNEESLAYYNKGHEFPARIVPNIVTAINSVLLPAMSEEQDNKSKVRAMTHRASNIASFIIWPTMVGLAVCGENLIDILLTEKWLPAVPFLYVFCFDCALWPVIYTGNNAITAIGRSDIYLRIQTIQKIIGIMALIVSLKYGVLMIAISVVFTSIIELVMVAFYLKKLLNYTYLEQIKATTPYVFLSIGMGVVIWFMKYLMLDNEVILILQIIFGVFIYISVSFLLRFESLNYLIAIVKNILQRRVSKDGEKR